MDLVAKLIAIEEIKQLKARYFRTMDTRDFDAMAQVFARDIRFDCTDGSRHTPVGGEPIGEIGPITEGRDAVMTWIRAAFANSTSVHHGHCHEVTIDSDTEAHGVIAMEDFIYELDRKTLIETLRAQGMTFEEFRKQVRDQWIEAQMRRKNVSQQAVISPFKVETYYQAHQDDFKVGDQVQLRMIVLKKTSADDTNTAALAGEIPGTL